MVTLARPIDAIGAETVVFTTEPEVDRNGDPIEGTATEYTVAGCAVWPAGTSEEAFRAATTTQDIVVAAPVYETDLSARMTVAWRGQTYTVDGEPVPWISLDGVYMGTQVNAERGS